MKAPVLVTFIAAAAMALPGGAQQLQRRAVLTGGVGAAAGRCTADIIVDGSAEVEIRGDNGFLRDLSGRPPEWRRFECTSAMPANPGGVRFTATGRGQARLVSDPRTNGVAVVRMDDPEPGPSIYHLEISWTGSGYPAGQAWERERTERGERDRMMGGFTADQAIQVCQDTVRQQAMSRFQTQDMYFRQVHIDDNPGRRDWVMGTLDVHPAYGPERHMRFSCSVDFETGRVRTVNLEPMEGGEGGYYRPATEINAQAFDNCRRQVADRIRQQGYDEVQFGSVNADNRPGRSGWVIGTVRAQGPDHPESWDFSCSVNLETGYVRSTELRRR